MPDLNNSSLVARCIKGERLAWNKLVERFSPLVFWAIKDRLVHSGYTYSQEDVEDAFQNVFVLLWEKGKLQQIKNRENISAWLIMVAANCAHNYFRNKRERPLEKETVLQKVHSDDCNANEVINQEKIQSVIAEAFNNLSARELIILKLNYFYDKTHQEIGQLLKISTNTVSSIIKRTKERLKEKLKNQRWKNF